MSNVLIELVVAAGLSCSAIMDEAAMRLPGVDLDRTYPPVPMSGTPSESALPADQQMVVVRGKLSATTIEQIKSLPGVINIWSDAKIEPFGFSP